jgi:hypothetical protein
MRELELEDNLNEKNLALEVLDVEDDVPECEDEDLKHEDMTKASYSRRRGAR